MTCQDVLLPFKVKKSTYVFARKDAKIVYLMCTLKGKNAVEQFFLIVYILINKKEELIMSNLKILLCCGAGMSSGFLASSARKSAKKRKIAANVEARSHTEVNDYLSSIDILMLGPHYASELKKYDALATPYGVPVVVIPQDIYAQLNGEKLLDLAIATVSERKN